MEETIKIQPVDRSNWSQTLKGFQSDAITELYAVYGADGQIVGRICQVGEPESGKYYINGQPEVDYGNLQAAAGALLRSR
jgi:hypothetical protein